MSVCRVGTETECQEVLLTRVVRKPPRWFAENAHGVRVVLAKGPKGTRTWDVLLPNGGIHTFKYKRSACAFINRLRKT